MFSVLRLRTVKSKIVFAAVVVYAVVAGIVVFTNYSFVKRDSVKMSTKQIETELLDITNEIDRKIQHMLVTGNSLNTYLLSNKSSLVLERIENYETVLYNTLEGNKDLISLSVLWEPGMLLMNDTLPDAAIVGTKRFYRKYYKRFFELRKNVRIPNETILMSQETYKTPSETRKIFITEPYIFSDRQISSSESLECSIVIPLETKDDLVCLTTLEVDFSWLLKRLQTDKPLGKGHYFLFTDNQTITIHPNRSIHGTELSEQFTEFEKVINLKQRLSSARNLELKVAIDEIEWVVKTKAFETPGQNSNWHIAALVPKSVLSSSSITQLYFALLLYIIGFIVVLLAVWLLSPRLSSQFSYVANLINEIANGSLDSKTQMELQESKTANSIEIESIVKATNLLTQNVSELTRFANEIGKGNLSYKLNQNMKNNVLGQSLLEMQRSLSHARTQEKDQFDKEAKRNWITNGIARFVAILQQNTTDINALSKLVIAELVRYLKAEIGGLYVYEERIKADKLVLTGVFAYDKQKFIDAEVTIGEGIVGTVALEKELIYLKKIPDNYIQISSGLGQAKPTVLLVVPLLMNNKLFGAIELAGFKEFKDYEINFVEKLAENIASSLAGTQAGRANQELLTKSEEQSRMLSNKEMEQRRSLMKMKNSQQEADRYKAETLEIMQSINSAAYRIEFLLDGEILDMNRKFADIFGKIPSLIKGSNIYDFCNNFTRSQLAELNFDSDSNEHIMLDIEFISTNGPFWLRHTFTAVRNSKKAIIKYRSVGFDVSELIKEKKEIEYAYAAIEMKEKNNKNVIDSMKSQLNNHKMDIALLEEEKRNLVDKLERRGV